MIKLQHIEIQTSF